MTEQRQEDTPTGGLQANVTRGIGDITVEVLSNNEVGHGDQMYHEGEQITMDGPTAIALTQAGHTKIVGSV